MVLAVRHRFPEPDQSASEGAPAICDFVRGTDYDAECQLRMRALASLMQRDIELQVAQDRIKALESVIAHYATIAKAVGGVKQPAASALSFIDDIRHGCNLTVDEMWNACGALDKVLSLLQDIDKLISLVPSAEKTVSE